MNSHALARPLAVALLIFAAFLALPARAEAPISHAQPTLPMAPLEVVTHKGVFHFHAELAVTERQQEIGLMYRPALPRDRAMLFEMGAPAQQSFWMKNCPVPIDMLFVQPDGTILSIAHNAAPYSETPISSGGPVSAVVELRGGRADEIGAQPGDVVRNAYFRGH